LMRHDKAFYVCMLKEIRKEKGFKKFEVQDVIDDIMECCEDDKPFWVTRYKRLGKHTAGDRQCYDDFDDVPERCIRFELPSEYERYESAEKKCKVPISMFPSMTIRLVRTENEQSVQIGQKIEVYRDGEPVSSLPRLEIEQCTKELQPLLDEFKTSLRFI